MKRILVPIDFSKYSEEALKVAAQIARKNKMKIDTAFYDRCIRTLEGAYTLLKQANSDNID